MLPSHVAHGPPAFEHSGGLTVARILHHLRIAIHYALQALKMRLEYRADFFVECLAALMQQTAGLVTLQFLFETFHAMKGWNKHEVFFIYGFSLIPMALFDAFAMNFYMFSDKYIVQGELDRLLLRPLSSLFQIFLEGISFDFLADLTLGIVVLSYAWKSAGPPFSAEVVLQFALCVFGAWGVLTGVFLALTSVAFWTEDRITLLPPVYNLLNFARYPLDIYRPFIRLLLTWAIPFGFVAFYPSAAFLEKGVAFRDLAHAVPLAGVALLLIGCLVWRRGVRRYSGAGN
jgi:ABC-2 type transport system permease protein